jgi:DNA-binding NarL/FixJ family response regulator
MNHPARHLRAPTQRGAHNPRMLKQPLRAQAATGDAPRNILLVDDHALFRAGMQLILGDGPEPLGHTLEAESVEQAIAMNQDVSLVLLDIELPGFNGLEGLTLLRRRWPKAAVVVLSAHESAANTARARALGAWDFVNKNASAEYIRRVVQQALHAQAQGLGVANDSSPTPANANATGAATPAAFGQSTPGLSARQLDVLALLCEGLSNKVIAKRLGLSENTVRNHLVTVMRHFQASTRIEVVMAAQRQGVVRAHP